MHPGQKLKPGARWCSRTRRARPASVIDRAKSLERRFFGRRLVRFAVDGAGRSGRGGRSRSATCRCRRTSIATIDPTTASATRPSSRARAGRSPRRPPVCTSTTRWSTGRGRAGIGWTTVTLHVGYGTFKPVRVERVEDHTVDAERYDISAAAADAIAATRARRRPRRRRGHDDDARARERGGRRTAQRPRRCGRTDLFIHPGHRFRVVDALLTNFHLPRSSLLMLVCGVCRHGSDAGGVSRGGRGASSASTVTAMRC